jgi:hypothetical protein
MKRVVRDLILLIFFAAAAFGGTFNCDYNNGPTTLQISK